MLALIHRGLRLLTKHAMVYSGIEDIRKVRGGKNKVLLTVYLESGGAAKPSHVCWHEFEVDLECMGLQWSDEFEMALGKVIDRAVRCFYENENRLPEGHELKSVVESQSFFMIDKRNVENYQVFHYEV